MKAYGEDERIAPVGLRFLLHLVCTPFTKYDAVWYMSRLMIVISGTSTVGKICLFTIHRNYDWNHRALVVSLVHYAMVIYDKKLVCFETTGKNKR